MHAIDDVQRKIKLRNRDATVNKGRFNHNQYEDGHLYDASQEAIDRNNGLDHQEEEEDSKWDTSLCFLD